MNKRTIFIILGGLVVLVLGGVAIFTAMRLQETTDESVAPNAPQSQPRAQQSETLPNNPVQVTFNVTGTASPSPTGSAAPTTAPAATSAPTTAPTTAPAATSAPTASPVGGPVSTATAKPAATSAPSTSSAQTLPEAGMSMPTILGIFGGALLLVAGLVLAL